MQKKLPNIIFILADDMGIGDLSCYGAEKIKTPHMDKVAENGIKFTDAHATDSICTPSRYAIMTGRYCWKTELRHSVIKGFAPPLIEKGRETLASMLKGKGYKTSVFGKWHLGLDWLQKDGKSVKEATGGDIRALGYDGFEVDYSKPLGGGPLDLGFDYWFGISGSLDMPPYCFIENDKTIGIPDREKEVYHNYQARGLQTDYYRDEEVDTTFAERAVKYIEGHAVSAEEKPFFMYLAAAAPHRPCDVRPDFVIDKTEAGDRGDMVYLFDWMVGQVVDVLQRTGLEENTLLVVTSDNGAVARCVNGEDYGHKSNGDYRGFKRDIWEGGHREPLVVQWPAQIKPGQVCDKLVCLADFFKTFAEISGAELSSEVAEDSISILPYLQDCASEEVLRDIMIHHSGNGMFSIRKGRWKLVDGLGSGGDSEPYYKEYSEEEGGGQLYDIISDPYEKTNLWLEKREIAEELTAELDDIVSSYFDRKGSDIMQALDPRNWQQNT
ncbi:MAG: sulfatase family protein [Planctomycetota bacterium]|jgi:arylsulfatase A-like enzyme